MLGGIMIPLLVEKARRVWRGQDSRLYIVIVYDSDKGTIVVRPRCQKGGLAALEKAAYQEALGEYKEKKNE
jgi:hypothetical protein